ncbi:MAG: hypothetical protein V2A55_00310 [Candidatus Jorgensenbacteria bacterium]
MIETIGPVKAIGDQASHLAARIEGANRPNKLVKSIGVLRRHLKDVSMGTTSSSSQRQSHRRGTSRIPPHQQQFMAHS